MIPFLLIGPHDPEIVRKLRNICDDAPIIMTEIDDPVQVFEILIAGADISVPKWMGKKAETAYIGALLRRC